MIVNSGLFCDQGGGGMMFIHQKRSNNSVVIDFREMAPGGAVNDK